MDEDGDEPTLQPTEPPRTHLGHPVTICPPAYAEGARPQHSIRPRGYVELDED